MKIVLASQSPRRRELLGRLGLNFTIKTSQLDESAFTAPTPQDLVQCLSREKALSVAREPARGPGPVPAGGEAPAGGRGGAAGYPGPGGGHRGGPGRPDPGQAQRSGAGPGHAAPPLRPDP